MCVDLDKQVTEFEAENEQLEEKVAKLEAELRDLVSKLDSTQVYDRNQLNLSPHSAFFRGKRNDLN